MKQTGKLAAIAVISTLTVLTLTAPSFGAEGVIKPPVTSRDFKLGPDDEFALVVNEWYCLDGEDHVDSPDLSLDGGTVKNMLADANDEKIDSDSKKTLLDAVKSYATMYLRDHTKAAEAFWSAEQPGGVELKPGGKATWEDCYTLDDLKKAKKEALRWAGWVKKNVK